MTISCLDDDSDHVQLPGGQIQICHDANRGLASLSHGDLVDPHGPGLGALKAFEEPVDQTTPLN
jgi:hypothetical protein